MKALIVDDSSFARRTLEGFLKKIFLVWKLHQLVMVGRVMLPLFAKSQMLYLLIS